jgi:hypothetical protein
MNEIRLRSISDASRDNWWKRFVFEDIGPRYSDWRMDGKKSDDACRSFMGNCNSDWFDSPKSAFDE